MAQDVIDVHSHIITPGFLSALRYEDRLMEEGFPLPKYDVVEHPGRFLFCAALPLPDVDAAIGYQLVHALQV